MILLIQLLHSSVNNTADVKPSLIYGENRADGNALEEENKSITLIYDTVSERMVHYDNKNKNIYVYLP